MNTIKKIWSLGWGLLDKYVVLRYLVVGGSAGIIDLLILYGLNDLLHIHYLIAAVIAFLVAFLISFTFHKIWTFKSFGERTEKQVMMYIVSSGFGLTLNTLFMYILVDHLNIDVILSQIIAGLLVACVSFFVSRNIVFKYEHNHQ